MQLVLINKQRYRRHLNIVIAACITTLVIGSLGVAQLLILLFPDPSGSHFYWNLLGVIATCLLLVTLLLKFKTHDFMTEVTYVWDLKQSLNKITRAMRKLKMAANQGNENAMNALQYSYDGSRQLWLLDDNVLTLESLDDSQKELDQLAIKYDFLLDAKNYRSELLKSL
ncbi:conserved hypothetical protein [Psychromonas ingrahamii 37]|uniref:DUF3087 domain-containing protein n=1 Tax=Psychromonas ingrahamii (strain DSM 17664 / CCUG 51855 / 37) TaxID=357804 RepID=A1SVW3_PSYIN|nr:DUF3087 domain-containing protein [Psychromonas ingrahamii]ABM03628.1 conserved hypothetical protein [Psychromonas ingrahamii 37]